jgi:hypothetical protein
MARNIYQLLDLEGVRRILDRMMEKNVVERVSSGGVHSSVPSYTDCLVLEVCGR